MKVKVNNSNLPVWKDISVKSRVPDELIKLEELTLNIWWIWNSEATRLFRKIDPDVWKKCGRNPVLLLDRISYERLEEIVEDKVLMEEINRVYGNFRKYIDEKPNTDIPSVAYFSMEYGLATILKIYSGGLGILAGDYLKEASDCNVDMTAVGFLYRYGYFTQSLSPDGQQIANYEFQNFGQLPLEPVTDSSDNQMVLEVPYPGRLVHANVWRVNVGRISLYLLDTDMDLNSEFDRSITHHLYGGDWENRMKQEYLLGVGGILLLKKLGIKKDVYHCNEGHAALINAQRLVDYIQDEKLTFDQALEVVRSSSLYTVHTPVPAGHDSFEEGLFMKYMSEFPGKMGISPHDLMDMGREHPGTGEKFSMSVFACNTCQEVNGVSWLHGKVSQEMFQPIWSGYFPEELHVSYVTNGVHMPTWTATEWKELYNKYFAKNWMNDESNKNIWEAIYSVDDSKIWETRQLLKKKLLKYIMDQFREGWLKNQSDPSRIISILEKINPNALLMGFGRRFATYKRAHLLFMDLDRLSKIVNNPQCPVQFIFSGKAHPADGGGQALIKHIIEISRRPEFLGKIIFLENYDMQLAKRLISGVDVWMNLPTRPLEASGTSGQKAEMNGVLNLSVLDGWWYEGYVEGAGWALTDKITYENSEHQDQLDAATIYAMLENQIIPMYFAKNSKGYSPEWIQYIKNSIAQIAPAYTTKRMLDDYIERFYSKLASRSKKLKADGYAKAKSIAAWKEMVADKWDTVKVVSVPDVVASTSGVHLVSGQEYTIEAVIDKGELTDSCLGVELVVTTIDSTDNNKINVVDIAEFDLVKTEENLMYFKLTHELQHGGIFKYSFRLFPKNPDLPHRMDMCYVHWF
ncbi:MAG: alpha-glucan family phosphorylase [Candidatus Azobacteroides sp.]|nr:alpha-glucan family phosphorylase [Candidatus Azobacteroides sp.]